MTEAQRTELVVRGIEFLNLRMLLNKQEIKSDNIDNWTQVIAMKRVQVLLLSHLKTAIIKYTILANRAIPFSAMAIVEINPLRILIKLIILW
jgi:hypothetical protein